MAGDRRKRSDPRPWTGRGERSRLRCRGPRTIRVRPPRVRVATTLDAPRHHREPNTERHNRPDEPTPDTPRVTTGSPNSERHNRPDETITDTPRVTTESPNSERHKRPLVA